LGLQNLKEKIISLNGFNSDPIKKHKPQLKPLLEMNYSIHEKAESPVSLKFTKTIKI